MLAGRDRVFDGGLRPCFGDTPPLLPLPMFCDSDHLHQPEWFPMGGGGFVLAAISAWFGGHTWFLFLGDPVGSRFQLSSRVSDFAC